MKWVVLTVYTLNFFSVFAILFRERKSPTVTLTWLLVLTYLPLLGLILYIFFGRGFRFNTRKKLALKIEIEKKYKEIPDDIKRDLYSSMILNDESIEFEKVINMHFNSNRSFYTNDNKITIFTDAKDKYSSLLRDISYAKKNIDMIYYIINNDETGKTILRALIKKAKQGIKVRIIYDDIGSIATPLTFFSTLKKYGGEVHKFSPLVGALLQSNYRNHRKIVVIDSQIGYTGGMNIGNEYYGTKPETSPWRDTHIRFTGSSVLMLQIRFALDWYYTTGKEDYIFESLNKPFKPIVEGNTGMQIVASGPDLPGEEIKRGIIALISMAKKKIIIQTPYLIPDNVFIETLQSAAISGVDISIMIPLKPDHKTVYYATCSYVQSFLEYGIKIYRYNGFIHAKTLVVDGKAATVGTTNMDIRSFSLHFEVNAFIYDRKVSQQLERIFENDIKNSQFVTKECYDKRGWKNKFMESIFRLLSPLF